MGINTKDLAHYLGAQEFQSNVQVTLSDANHIESSFALVSLDFDNFNFINDIFGFYVGDKVLQRIKEHFSSKLKDGELFSCLHADHFTFLVNTKDQPNVPERFRQMSELKIILSDILPPNYSLISSGGVVYIGEYQDDLLALMDKTNFARKRAKGHNTPTILNYDKKMNEEREWRKIVTSMMEVALQEGEFEMHLQPKVLFKTEQIVGAEALARWKSKKYGMIYPDRFIPILEENGFIQELDFFILEEACIFLENSISLGIAPMPISVNFSKMHIHNKDFVDRLSSTVKKHKISTKMVEIEFTESVYLSDVQTLKEVFNKLKYLGFKVVLDDFGSAYSSLNHLKDLPLDIIKIDKGFLERSANTDKGRLIITKMVELIKSLRMLSVVEGVETEEQSEFLQKLSCDFGQGYFYAKPMPKEAYVEFLRQGSPLVGIEEYLVNQMEANDVSYLETIPQEFEMDNWELYTLGQNINMGLMKGYLDGDAKVQYVNDCALEYLRCTRQEFHDTFKNSIVAFIHPEDAHIARANAKQLIDSGTPLQFKIRAIRKDGKVIVLQGRSSCVIDSWGRPIGIYAFQDVTEEIERTESLQNSLEDKIAELEYMVASEHESREALRINEERYRLIVEQSDSIMFEWDFATDSIVFSDKYEDQFGRTPVRNDVTTNPVIREHIHPADLEIFEECVKNTYKMSGSNETEYRMKVADGSFVWFRNRSTAIDDNYGNPIKAVGVFSNIHQEKTKGL
ncbi:MAG: EAL domain-containing protein [Anaerovoracaceae bacterium]